MKQKLHQCILAGAAWLLASCAAIAQTPAAPPPPLKIGVLTDMSSINSHMGGAGAVVAAKMAVQDFGGKVNGRVIEVVSADHQGKPEVAATIARKWYENDGVEVITELTNSAVAIAVQNVAKGLGKINIVSGGVTEALIGKECSPTGIHWTFDTYSLAVGTTRAVVQQGAKRWFFITADYAFGQSMQARATEVINSMGATLVGSVLVPQGTKDFSSYLLRAKASGADAIALAVAGNDLLNAIKQAKEFGITKGGQRLVASILFIPEVHALGLETAQGLTLTTNFYWDRDDSTRAWSKRFYELHGSMPTSPQAGNYSSVTHYLKAVAAARSSDPKLVLQKMRATPVNDFYARNGHIREDGKLVHELILAEVKKPGESQARWDYYKVLAPIPSQWAFIPLEKSECSLVKK